MVRIRLFLEGNQETYVRVYNDGYSTEDWWRTLEKPMTLEDALRLDYDATFFAEVDGQSVGLVDVKIHGDEAHIENLVVVPEHRRKGIGTALLRKAIEFSEARSVKKIRAETPIQDGSKFFEKKGFKLSRHAFLIHVKDKAQIEPPLKLSSEGKGKYWVDDDRQMESVTGKLDFKIIAEFKVMVKSIRSKQ